MGMRRPKRWPCALLAWRVWGGADMKNNRAADFGSHGAWGAVLFDVFTEERDCLGAISRLAISQTCV